MNVIFIITALLILLYFAYPVWLKTIAGNKVKGDAIYRQIDGVSLVLLSYNGKEYLERKIAMLLDEIKVFPGHEMIIVDDHSTDGSQAIINQFKDEECVQIILKEEHKGIPHTMNLAVGLAKYDHLVFCDQRQGSSRDILRKLVEPLGYEDIGAVSACISDVDKSGCSSVLRRYENFLKMGESNAGSLMGVYGPLYAIKKCCYAPIPEQIILDDLYLSLKVMATKSISIKEECRIFDEHICSLHDYRRIRRYLTGFLQLLSDRNLLKHLPKKQLTMLFWHKYLRLLIPLMLFLCYVSTAVLSIDHQFFIWPFITLTILGIASLTPAISKVRNMLIHFVRINVLYVLAMGDLLVRMKVPE